MSAVARGSKQKQVIIPEVTFGVTPTTPVMIEMPIVDITRNHALDSLKSGAIRSHPFVDQISEGMFTHTVDLDFELQDATHDLLLQAMFGSTITAKAMKVADALSSLSLEAQATDRSLFDQFSGMYFEKMDFSVAASDKAPIKIKLSGGAKVCTIDASSTIATSVTAAPDNAPFVFGDATLTIGGVATPVTTTNFSLARTINPLNLIGTRLTDQFVPDAVTLTGQITVPLESNVQSGFFTGFTDAPLVINCTSLDGTQHRTFTIPKTKFNKLGRQVQNRGAILQTIDWEAYYDLTSATIMTLTTE